MKAEFNRLLVVNKSLFRLLHGRNERKLKSGIKNSNTNVDFKVNYIAIIYFYIALIFTLALIF